MARTIFEFGKAGKITTLIVLLTAATIKTKDVLLPWWGLAVWVAGSTLLVVTFRNWLEWNFSAGLMFPLAMALVTLCIYLGSLTLAMKKT